MAQNAIAISSTPPLHIDVSSPGPITPLGQHAQGEAAATVYRSVRILPFELREQCLIYLDEALYKQALNLCLTLLTSGASTTTHRPAIIAPPHFLSFFITVIVHPTFTTRVKAADHEQTAVLASKYLWHILQLTGPINSHLAEACSFASVGSRTRAGTRGRNRTSNVGDQREETAEKRLQNDFANSLSLFQCAQDIWHIIGWAFNCSELHPHRWQVWKLFLDWMIQVLETDWQLRVQSNPQSVSESLIVAYLQTSSGIGGYAKRILRAIFASGTTRSVTEFPEIWLHETRQRKTHDGDVRRNQRQRINIEENNYGDYLENNSDSQEEDESSETSQHAESKPHRRNAREKSQTLSHFDELGSIRLRTRLMALVAKVSTHSEDLFMPSTTLYELYLDELRQLSLPSFASVFSPLGLETFTVEAASSLTQFVLRAIISSSAPAPSTDELSQDVLETYYLPFTANRTQAIIENARVSLCIETLLRMLDRYDSGGLEWTPELQNATEKGIEARTRNLNTVKGSANDEASIYLRESSQRIRTIVALAMARMAENVTDAGLTSQTQESVDKT